MEAVGVILATELFLRQFVPPGELQIAVSSKPENHQFMSCIFAVNTVASRGTINNENHSGRVNHLRRHHRGQPLRA